MKNIFLIINYNDWKTTEKLVLNIKNYACIHHIIVVDNASSDPSYQKLSKMKDEKVEVIQNDKNGGYAAGINKGVQYALKKYKVGRFAIANPDIEFHDEKDLEKLFKACNKDFPLIAPTVNEHGKKNRGWKLPTTNKAIFMNIPFLYRLIEPLCIHYKNKHYKGDVSKVDVVSGCFFIMNATVLKEVGYFDENTFLYYEENILAKKLKNKGYDIYVRNDICITHNHAVTIDKNIDRICKYKTLKNSEYYFHKEYNHANYYQLLILKLMYLCTYTVLKLVCKKEESHDGKK